MRLSLIALAASASTALAAPRIDIEANQVILGCGRTSDAASGAPLKDDWMGDFGDTGVVSTSDDFQTKAGMAEYDRGVADAVGWDNGKQLVGFVDKDGQVNVQYYNKNSGKSWQPSGVNNFWKVGGGLDRTLSMFQMGGAVFLAGVTSKNVLVMKYFRNENFYPSQNSWIYLDTGMASTPSMTSHDNKTISLVVRGRNGYLYYYAIDPSNDFQTYSVKVGDKPGIKNPTLVSRKSGTLDVLQYDEKKTMHHASWDGKSWSNFRSVNGPWPRGSPTALGRGGKLEFFGVGNDNRVYKQVYNGSDWSALRVVGSNALQTVSALYYGDSGGSDVYYHDAASVKQARFNGDGNQGGPWDMGGQLFHSPIAFTWGDIRVDLWGIGMDGALYQKSYDRGFSWSGWVRFGGSAMV